MDSTKEHFALFVAKDLEKLSQEERDFIRQVVERNQELENNCDQQFSHLKNEITTLQRTRDAEVDFVLDTNSCAVCMVLLGRFFNSGASCPNCVRTICKGCRIQKKSQKKWMCLLCAKEWELRLRTGGWMGDRGPHTTGPALVLRQLDGLQQALENMNNIINQQVVPLVLQQNGGSKVKFLTGSSSNEDIVPDRTIIEFNPILPRRSIHGLHRPLPMPGDSKVIPADVPVSPVKSPGFAEKLAHRFQEVASMMHIESESVLTKSGTKLPISFFAQKRRNSDSFLTTSMRLKQLREAEIAKDQQNINFDPQGPPTVSQYTENTLVPLDAKHGRITSTPYNIGDSYSNLMTIHGGKPSKMDVISVSTLTSDVESGYFPLDGKSYGDVSLKVSFDLKTRKLSVFVSRCRGLPLLKGKLDSLPSPYVKVYLCGSMGERIKKKTCTKDSTSNPQFEELLIFPKIESDLENWYLTVVVCCKKGFFRHTVVLGKTSILISKSLLEKKLPYWMPLHKMNHGVSGGSEAL